MTDRKASADWKGLVETRGKSPVRRVLVAIVVALVAGFAVARPPAARAALTPNGTEYHPLTFPVVEPVHYYDDFGGVRRHPGNDLMGAKLDHELAANDGTITFARSDASGHSGNMLILTGTDGWKYWYIHINNDTPGTDDGKNPAQWRFAPGIAEGVKVKRGKFIAYMGDSGEAETTDPHLHFELHRPDDSFINPYTSLRLAQGAGANGLCAYPSNPTPHPTPGAGRGFWTLARTGAVLSFGQVQTYGTPPSQPSTNPYVAIAPTPAGVGYWVVDARGNVRVFGNASWFGDMGTRHINAPMIGIATTPTGKGYWLLGRDGGIFRFGDTVFWGSTGNKHLNAPIIGMSSTAGGKGYWLLGADGGIFTFGDAGFFGSTGNKHLNAPVIAMSATSTGLGYWLLGRDGGIFTFGDARYRGSLPGTGWCPGPSAVAMARTKTDAGYWVMLDDGHVLALGDAQPWGEPATTGGRAVSLAAAK